MRDIRTGHPVERAWILWHALIGLGAGLLFIPGSPPVYLVVMFLVTSLTVILGVQFAKRRLVTLGLWSLAIPQVTRAIAVWNTHLGAGSRLVATFLWSMLAVGAIMEGYSVHKRGIS